jgi:L-amino acid N-acyltransferase YncA
VSRGVERSARGGTGMTVEPMRSSDWPDVRSIYLEGIATGNATFETDAPSWEAWDSAHMREPRLTARDGAGRVLGWAALTPVSGRCVYAGVGDLSVYVSGAARGKGVGRALLEALIESSERAGIWTLQAGIFPDNAASLALHRACGFRDVGRRERIGKLNGVWRDVLLLERRSRTAGAG